MDTKDQKDIDSTLAKVEKEHTLSDNNKLAMPNQFKGVDIEGMEDVPMNLTAVPYVRVIQPSSQNTTLDNGKEAQVGSFLFNDTQKEFSELDFVLLRAKHHIIDFERDG